MSVSFQPAAIRSRQSFERNAGLQINTTFAQASLSPSSDGPDGLAASCLTLSSQANNAGYSFILLRCASTHHAWVGLRSSASGSLPAMPALPPIHKLQALQVDAMVEHSQTNTSALIGLGD